MKKRSRQIREHRVRRAHRKKRSETAASRRLAAKIRNRIPHGMRSLPQKGLRKPKLDDEGTIKIPGVFSLLEDPERTLYAYHAIENLLRLRHKRKLYVYHSGCREMDLGASILMDTLFMRAQSRRQGRGEPPLEVQGYLSRFSHDVNIMLVASGLPTRLGIKFELTDELKDRIRTFERQSGTASHLEKETHRNQCATDLTNYFDGCLRKKGYSLSDVGLANLGNLITEVIGNAQEHAGPWHAIGFYDDNKLATTGAGECHIVIFNYGPSIYETLLADDVSPELQTKLRELSEHHESNGWLSRTVFRWGALTEEVLWTLFALQDRITRFYGRPEGKDRGAGTVKMIEFFEQLAGSAPMRMCILSGNAYILFDGTHRIRPVVRGDEELKVIAFNDDNDLQKAPDPKYVRALKNSFPGTVISIKLTLDSNVLEQLAAQGKRNEPKSQ